MPVTPAHVHADASRSMSKAEAPQTSAPSPRASSAAVRSAGLAMALPAVRLTTKTNAASGTFSGLPGGQPLSPAIQSSLERSLQVDLHSVRVHTDANAHSAVGGLSARAFTYGTHVFLGRRERPTDLALMAHETAHVVQQQGAPRLQGWIAGGQTDSCEREAHRASSAVLRHESFTVKERTSGLRVQGLGIGDALDYFAKKANLIPGFRMFTIILGVNPINMSRVERSAANILRALIEIIPGGALITQALDNHGIFDKVGKWIEQQIQTLGLAGSTFRQAITRFLDSLGWRDIFDLGGVWERAKRIFTEPIDRIINFAKGLVTGIIRFIKDAILRPLAKLAERTRGYDLLKAILGQDPVTGDAYPRTAETLIGGFMKLIGQEEVWNNIKKANAITRAWAWFQGALNSLLGFVRQIPGLFLAAFQSLELADIILVPRAFVKVASVIGGFIGNFISWAGNAVWTLLQIIFEVVAPGAMPYLKKAADSFRLILKNPVGFVGNLVRAAKLGFQQFAAKIGMHLKNSLIRWITGALAGANIYIPQSFEIRELVKFVLSVLGLTWQNIRQKLVKVVGETAVKAMETGFDIVVTLVRDGPAAAWEKIKEQLSNLKEMVMEGIMSFVTQKIVQAAVTKLLSMLTPAGAFIQAIIAIYNTVMFFVERLKQIIQVATAFIDSISAIARGVIAAAADRVEQTLAGLLTLVISFLARLVGLGKVSDAVVDIINKLRAQVDKAIDKVIDWIVTMAKKLYGAAKATVRNIADFVFPKMPFVTEGKKHELRADKKGATAELVIAGSTTSVAQYLSRLKQRIAAISDKTKQKKADGLHTEALKQSSKAAKALEDVFVPKTGPTKAEQELKKQSEALLDLIKEIWAQIGVGDLLPGEAAVDSYAALGKVEDQTGHHVPQNAIMNRVSAWLIKYLSRATDSSVKEHREKTLAGLGVKFESLKEYYTPRGIAVRMEKTRHEQTRTYGKLPDADLDIPKGTPKDEWVKFRPVNDQRMKEFVFAVSEEFRKDKEDVFAIYSGRKGLPAVSNIQLITASVRKLGGQNSAKWGRFLQ